MEFISKIKINPGHLIIKRIRKFFSLFFIKIAAVTADFLTALFLNLFIFLYTSLKH